MKACIILVISYIITPFLAAKSSASELGITPAVRWSEITLGKAPDQPIIYNYEVGGDTMINELLYYKLIKDNIVVAAVREDEEQKIFVYFPETNQEQLLYDFHWENDTDSIRLFNNQSYAIKNNEYGKVIQGIGSLNGFFAPLHEAGTSPTELLCYWKNGQLLYLNPNYTNCEGGTTYKSCFGKEYTKYTVIEDSRLDYVGSISIVINDKLEVNDNPDNYFTEDVSSGEVTFKTKVGEVENMRKIMNLNVWIGDTILLGDYFQSTCFHSIYEYYYGNKHYVNSDGEKVWYALVDSIYFEDNRKHVRMDVVVRNYHCTNGICDDPYLFIEGRGPNIGLSSYLDSDACTYLLCYETESESYLNPFFEKCDYYLRIPSLVVSDFFQAKQIDNKLQVTFIQPFSGRLYLYDHLGRICCETFIEEQKETMLPIIGFPRGIYFLRCNDITGKVLKPTKLIIQ